MKKVLSILVIIMLFSLLITGCSDPNDQDVQNNEDTEEEVTPDDSEGEHSDLDKDNEDTEEEVVPRLFEDVYSESGLVKAIAYVHDGYDSFNEESLSNYLDSLEETISEKASNYGSLIYFEVYPSQIPNTIEYAADIYKDIYYPEENQFNVNVIAQGNIDEALALNDDELFTYTKAYYAMDGSIEDLGFRMIVKKEVYDMLCDLYPGESFDGQLKETSLNISSYTDHYTSMDNEFQSEYTYPIVLVETYEKIEELRDEWKTEVLIPVEIVNIPVEENDSMSDDNNTPDESEDDSESDSENTPDESGDDSASDDDNAPDESGDEISQGFSIEEFKSIPEETTDYFEFLNPLYEDVEEEYLTEYYFEIKGDYTIISLVSTQNMGVDPESFSIDYDGSNMFLVYKTSFPSDFSSDTINIVSENGNEYNLQLNDGADRDLYKFLE